MAESDVKPRVLVLGGVGFIGRNFLKYLLENQCCSLIRIADKAMPAIARMHPDYERLYDSDTVQYLQVDLTKDDHVDRAFNLEGGFDFVFNLAAETRYGQASTIYEQRCKKLSQVCATKACGKTKRFVEVSTALVYKSQARRPSTESSDKDPFTEQSKAKLAAEQEILALTRRSEDPLDAVILRPVFVYGPGDVNGIMPRIVCAAAYQQLDETMKFLWDAQMKLNTVHVFDVCAAMWHVAINRARIPSGSVWNVCDKGDTDQGRINDILGVLFGIKVSFHGSMISTVARLRLNDVVDTANDKHMTPWDELCKEHNIRNTPLSPFMSRELLDHHHVFVDGSAIEGTGFHYSVPLISEALVRECVVHAIQSEIFPPVLVESATGTATASAARK